MGTWQGTVHPPKAKAKGQVEVLPIPAGKGKGKAEDEGKGKGGYGKGYQGTCWRCGKVGHKAHECYANSKQAKAIHEDAEESEEVIGGVWMIGSVDVEEKTAKIAKRPSQKLDLSNRFEALGEIAEEKSELEEIRDIYPDQKAQFKEEKLPRTSVSGKVRDEKTKQGIKMEASNLLDQPLPGATTHQPSSDRATNLSGDACGCHSCEQTHEEFGYQNEIVGVQDKYLDKSEVLPELEPVCIAAAGKAKATRESGLTFNVADVSRPQASAMKVVEAGNRIVMDPNPEDCYIENKATGEKMRIRQKKGTFFFGVLYTEVAEEGVVTLDSGAGVNVWPKEKFKEIKLMPKVKDLKMVAANGTDIGNYGQKLIKFRGVAATTTSTFTRPM